ncbi:MAG: phosphoribosylanthranilate isomerase [Myxococcales bacterium]|nr:phosphoribosylanthranilate isomerase [Myxococcales bacterium]
MSARLKICGVTRPEDIAACAELGVDAIGINLWRGSRRGLSLAEAESLLHACPAPGLERVGVFVDPTRDELLQAHARLRLDLVQVVGEAAFDPPPGVAWTWVIRGTPELAALHVPSPAPARILLDAAVAGWGGAGQTTDWAWALAAAARLSAHAPVWLAGGITPDNAATALAAVRPAGLDVASGAEPPGAARGEKDRGRVAALVAACRAFV